MNSTESTMQLEDFIMLLLICAPEWREAYRIAALNGAPLCVEITVNEAPRSKP